jgi:hypothetical protein
MLPADHISPSLAQRDLGVVVVVCVLEAVAP